MSQSGKPISAPSIGTVLSLLCERWRLRRDPTVRKAWLVGQIEGLVDQPRSQRAGKR